MNRKALLTSPAQLRKLLPELLPDQGNWSEEQYLLLTDHSARLIEFTDGYLDVLPMPTDKHQAILLFMYRALYAFLLPLGGNVKTTPLRCRIRPGKFREPDLLLVKDAHDARRQNRFWTGADLALEVVSPGKPQRDLIQKRKDYAESGIAEYWIVNPLTQKVLVLTLAGIKYRRAGTFERGDVARSVTLPGFEVIVADVFDAE